MKGNIVRDDRMSLVTAVAPTTNQVQSCKRSFHFQSSVNHSPKRRATLPISSGKNGIIAALKQHDVLIIVGETASGKTTQIPQYILNSKVLNPQKCIAVTQPRRVAATSLARRVAYELNTKVGDKVGYCVRFDEKTSKNTRIKFLTDGMLLREAMSHKNLKKYGAIIIDEAHERTIHTDILFGILKKIKQQRVKTPLKLIIMSATLDADHFSKFFNYAKVLYIQGREHPIKTYYCKAPQTDYVNSSLVTALQIHLENPLDGDILVFLTGQEEIESGQRILLECCKAMPLNSCKLSVLSLFGALPMSQQVEVFKPAPKGHRKIILSTNIAETSLTIRGVKYVVDSGRVKQKRFDPKIGLETLQVQLISKAQARQRQGRSGREGPGICYRLLTEEEFLKAREVTIPEIQRCQLSNILLNLLSLGISDVVNFEWIDKPAPECISAALRELHFLEAVFGSQTLALTAIGNIMAQFPLSPIYSRIIIKSRELMCSADMITLMALLSVDAIFYNPQNKMDLADAVRKRFYCSDSDHVTLVRIYKAAVECKFEKEWCARHYLNQRALVTASNVRKQLKTICKKHDIKVVSSTKWEENIRKALLYGQLHQVAKQQPDHSYISLSNKQQTKLHPSSVLVRSNTRPSLVVYDEMIVTSSNFIRTVSAIEESWLEFHKHDFTKLAVNGY